MSYEPTNWKTGDVVTSAKLNKLENAVAQSGGGNSGVLIVHINRVGIDEFTADKTYAEVAQAIANNELVVAIYLNSAGVMLPRPLQTDSFSANFVCEANYVDGNIEFIQKSILMTNDGAVSLDEYTLTWAGTETT